MSGPEQRSVAMDGRGWLALLTGLNLSFAVCFLIAKAPDPQIPAAGMRLLRSVVLLVVACGAGGLGTWVVLPRSSRPLFGSLLRCGFRGWIFLPAIAFFLKQESMLAPCLAVASAALIAICLEPLREERIVGVRRRVESTMFAMEIQTAPPSWVPFGISACVYGAVLLGASGRLTLMTLCVAIGSFLSVGQIVAAFNARARTGDASMVRKSHPYSLLTIAFWCAFFALSVASSSVSPYFFALWARAHAGQGKAKQAQQDRGANGYHTIVLLPMQKQEKTLPASALHFSASSSRSGRPWIIPFNGPYWYFKSVGETPGPDARTVRGDSLKVSVRSTDRSPLLMEAHQRLSEPIDLSCCREIQVVFRNDLALGAFALGVTLTDSQAKLSQSLGMKYVIAKVAAPSSHDAAPFEQTLVFPFPRRGTLKQFDAVTVTLLPDAGHLTAGRKVAVERFVMVPR